MQKRLRKKHPFLWGILLFFTGVLWLFPFLQCRADEPYIIVIDPGHSGENLGAQFDGYTEKEMTMAVARAMKEELERYDNVIVYLTHENDEDMSIKDRALFAAERNADFVFCLHFNASVHHNLYGAEVWVPAYGDFYVKGRQFAEIEMQLLSRMGLYSRGIKTRLNNAEEDYYGILRYCSAEGIPSVLIEHCHMDHANDKPFYQKDEEQLAEFGRLDAEAVAKYLGLSSIELGVDYSNHPLITVTAPDEGEPVRPDKTEPEICSAEILSIQKETGEMTVRMKAQDADSYIQYYSYSLDGGNTYSELYKWSRPYWNHSDEELVFTITVPTDRELSFVAKAYNGFDVFSESNIISIPALSDALKKEQGEMEEKALITPFSYEETEKEAGLKPDDRMQLLLLIVIISLFMAAVLYAMLRMIGQLKRNNRRWK